MVHTKTFIFTYFYQQYLVLFTMVPRNSSSSNSGSGSSGGDSSSSNNSSSNRGRSDCIRSLAHRWSWYERATLPNTARAAERSEGENSTAMASLLALSRRVTSSLCLTLSVVISSICSAVFVRRRSCQHRNKKQNRRRKTKRDRM